VKLVLQQPGVCARRGEQVAVEPLEIARDRLGGGDRLDPVDGGGVALGGQACAFDAVDARDLRVEVVDRVRQVGCRPPALPAADRAVVEH
jgi:hypothetical protein